MSADTPHLSDERLLLLRRRRAASPAAPRQRGVICAPAPPAATRFEQIEASAAEFGHAYRHDRDAETPSPGALAPRAQGAAGRHQATESARRRRGSSRARSFWRRATSVSSSCPAGAGRRRDRQPVTSTVRPIAYLTPGATRRVVATICAPSKGATARRISPQLAAGGHSRLQHGARARARLRARLLDHAGTRRIG